MGALLEFTRPLESLECGECGITFGVPSHWLAARRDNGDHEGAFWCPNGHPRVFREPAVVRLRRELEAKKRELEQKETALKFQRERAAKAEEQRERAKRKLQRVKNGVCPCCQRSFTNLRRHIAAKHPDFDGGEK